MKIVICFAAVGAALIPLCGCKPAVTEAPAKPEPPVHVQLVSPKHGEISRSVVFPGNVLPYQQVTLYAKVGGYLKKIYVDKGDAVKEGDLLAEIEVPELVADIPKYKAEIDVAEADFKRVSAAQKKAPDLVVAQTVDDAKGKLDIAKANLQRLETLLQFSKITAPFSGVVTKRFVDTGAFIPAATSGSAAQNAALLTLVDASKVRVQTAVPESEVPLIKNGLPVKISIEELPGKTFAGTITRYAHALDDATKTMLVEVELPNDSRELSPGMYASVKIAVEKKADALLLPVEAVLVEKTKNSVFVLGQGNNGTVAKKTVVKTGFNDGTSVELVDAPPADKVILLGKQTLADGQAVVAEAK